MIAVITVIHLLIVLALIAVVLMQRSEGGALGIGGGGGGGAGGLFTARGAGNALTRTTAFLAVAFFITSLTLAILSRGAIDGSNSVLDQVAPSAPAQGQQEGGNSGGGSVLPQLPTAPSGPAVPTE
jgi:preprotein translocase subunit SecG